MRSAVLPRTHVSIYAQQDSVLTTAERHYMSSLVTGSGTVDFPEFLNMMAKKMESTDSDAQIREAFRVFDCDRTGNVRTDELRFVMRHMTDKITDAEIEEMLDEADTDGNGTINYDGG